MFRGGPEGGGEINTNNSEIPRTLSELEKPEITRFKALIDQAHAVTGGKYLYAEESLIRLQGQLEELQYNDDPGVSELKAEARKLIGELPGAEMGNFISRTEESLAEGDIEAARRWHSEAKHSMKNWTDKNSFYRFTPNQEHVFKGWIEALDKKLYKWIV
jgi:hypothetical protein